MIPPEQNGSFVANMEMVLDVYKRPFDPLHPIICMDESPKQLISETRKPIPASPGRSAKYDYEYKRCGMANIFLACEPLAGKRKEAVAWQDTRNNKNAKVNWQFATADARVKLSRLYPTLNS